MIALETQRGTITIREIVLHAGLLLVLLAVLFPATFTRGEVAIASDLLYEKPPWDRHQPADYQPVRNETTLESVTQFSAWYRATQEALRDGEWPLWYPYAFLGVPLLANYQSAVLYPPHILTAWLDVPIAMTLYVLLKLWLCGMFAYVCARGLGLRPFFAEFAALGWMLGGYVQVWCYWAEVDVGAWLPLLLLSAEWLAIGRRRRGFFLMALSATLMLIAGHPETALVMSAGVACYFFIRLAQLRQNVPSVIALAAAAWALALTINAAQILPFLEYLKNSHTFSYRAVQESVDYFVPNHGFLALIAPKFFGFTADGNYWGSGQANSNFVHIVYVGVPVLFGIASIFVRGIPSALRTRIIALAPPAILSLLLAFDLPVLARVHDLPVLSSAWEIHALSFAAFGLPLLAAFGLQTWFSRPRKLRELMPHAGLAVLIAGVLVMAFSTYLSSFPNEGMRAYEQHQVAIAVGLSVATLALLAHHAVGRSVRWAQWALVATLAIDLLLASGGMRPTTRRENVFPVTTTTEYLNQHEGPVRIAATPTGAAGNTYPNFGIEQFYGYDGIFPARMKRFVNELAPDGWERAEPLLAITHYLHPIGTLEPDAAPEAYRLERVADGIEIRANLKAMPRVRLVGMIEQIESEDELIDRIRNEDFDGSKVVVMQDAPSLPSPTNNAEDQGTAEIVSHTTQSVEIAVNATEPCVLVLADAYYPGWRATIDGKAVEIYPAYHVLRAVPVPAGEHDVRFEFAPRSFWIGYGISIAGMIAALLIGILAWRRSRL